MADQVQQTIEALSKAARVASVMIDGDEARRIIVERATYYLAHPHPEHRFLAGDYYDVDHDTFLRMKKTLLRLERLLGFAYSTALWVPVEGLVGYVTLAVQNGSVHRYYRFGQEKLALPDEMAQCLKTGQAVVAPLEHPSQTITVLAPVFDSLGDVTGIVELTTQHPDAQSPAPAWS
jgi:hypothetical protein